LGVIDGHQALIRRIVTMDGAPNVVLPSGPGKPLPRYVVQEAGAAQRTMGVGGQTEANPEIVVRVETVGSAYATENNTMTQALVDRFGLGERFDNVTITQAPRVTPPLPVTDGVYAVPVVISGRIYFA